MGITDKNMDKQWIYVDMRKVSDTSIVVDLSGVPSGTFISGVRYAWDDRYGCGALDMRYEPCPMGSHPLLSETAHLPAMPFILRIEGNTCGCVAPQECNALASSQFQI